VLGDVLPERLAIERELLQFAVTGVRGAGEDDAGFVGAVEEGLQRPTAEVGVERDGVEAEPVEDAFDITLVRCPVVAALGVANGDDVGMLDAKVVDRVLELPETQVAAGFVEGDVWFVGANVGMRLLDNPAIEGELRLRVVEEALRQAADVAVEANAGQRVCNVDAGVELGFDGGDGGPPSGIKKRPRHRDGAF